MGLVTLQRMRLQVQKSFDRARDEKAQHADPRRHPLSFFMQRCAVVEFAALAALVILVITIALRVS